MSVKLQIVTNTAVDLGGDSPFGVGFCVTAVNMTAGALVLQTSSDNGVADAWATVASLGASTSATAMQTTTELKRYVRVSTAGTVFLLG